jgi:hypothetical protein
LLLSLPFLLVIPEGDLLLLFQPQNPAQPPFSQNPASNIFVLFATTISRPLRT